MCSIFFKFRNHFQDQMFSDLTGLTMNGRCMLIRGILVIMWHKIIRYFVIACIEIIDMLFLTHKCSVPLEICTRVCGLSFSLLYYQVAELWYIPILLRVFHYYLIKWHAFPRTRVIAVKDVGKTFQYMLVQETTIRKFNRVRHITYNEIP